MKSPRRVGPAGALRGAGGAAGHDLSGRLVDSSQDLIDISRVGDDHSHG